MSITIDATNQSLGRLASHIAFILRAKHRPDFTPNRLDQEKVIVINVDKIKLTGKKSIQKEYISHSGYLGHLKVLKYPQIGPERALHQAVWGMLPKNRLRKKAIKKLLIQARQS